MMPLVLVALSQTSLNWHITAALLFAIASATDYFDGYYARKFNAVSAMGQFMDPIADKILVTSTLVMMSFLHLIDPWMVVLILGRDTFIGGIRSVAAAEGVIIAAKPAGKWKTAMQMVAIPAVMVGDVSGIPLLTIGYYVLWISVILSITSGVEYYLGYVKGKKNG